MKSILKIISGLILFTITVTTTAWGITQLFYSINPPPIINFINILIVVSSIIGLLTCGILSIILLLTGINDIIT